MQFCFCFLRHTFDSPSFVSFSNFIYAHSDIICSAFWEDLKGVARERQDQLMKAEECHRCYQDLTDALTLIQVPSASTHHMYPWRSQASNSLSLCLSVQERQKSIPDDVAKDLQGVMSQLKKHDALLHELAAMEQQVWTQRDNVLFVLLVRMTFAP